MGKYSMSKNTDYSYEEAIKLIKEQLKEEGF